MPLSKNTPDAGRLVLVVGPSGVGKDTLLAGVRDRLGTDPDVVFPTRWITRPADAGGEDHVEIRESEFSAMESRGQFALAWRAHGLAYGVPIEINQDLQMGRTVVVNVSRQVLDIARDRFGKVRVISITAAPDVVAGRLRARGRESESEISDRLARATAINVEGDDVIVVRNDGTLQTGIDQMAAAIRN